MTSQDKIRFLRQYKDADRRIKILCEELSEWRSRALKITPEYTDMPKAQAGTQGRTEAACEKIIELEDEINGEIDLMQILRKKVTTAIKTVPDLRLQTLLMLYYINNFTWERIAVEMGYSWRQVIRLHGKALLEMQDVIECHT